jgi:hypothetical protein
MSTARGGRDVAEPPRPPRLRVTASPASPTRDSTGYDDRTGHRLVRDGDFMKTGDSIGAFMLDGAKGPFVIVVHSVDRSLREDHGRSRKLNVIPIAHP